MITTHSAPFKSADGRVLYVTMSSGQRRRVSVEDGQVEFYQRLGKAAIKARKRQRGRSRANLSPT